MYIMYIYFIYIYNIYIIYIKDAETYHISSLSKHNIPTWEATFPNVILTVLKSATLNVVSRTFLYT